MALTESEKAAVRYHSGYISTSIGNALALGIPDASQLQFIVEAGMNNILESAEPRLRRCLQELDCIEDQMSAFRGSLEVVRTGSVEIRGPAAFEELDEQYVRWLAKLLDLLGVPRNPFSKDGQRYGGLGMVIEPGM
jgi:hypothetical protein